MKTGKSSRLSVAAIMGLLLAGSADPTRPRLRRPKREPRPRPNRYLNGFNRSQEMQRRRRQIERGYLRPENGLVKP